MIRRNTKIQVFFDNLVTGLVKMITLQAKGSIINVFNIILFLCQKI